MIKQLAQRFLVPLAIVALYTETPSQAAADVLRFYKPIHSPDVRLLDANGTIVHVWQTQAQLLASAALALQDDGTLLGAAAAANGVQRRAFDGTLLWNYRSEPGRTVHHDIEPLPNGNVLLIAREDKTAAEAIAQGRNPKTVATTFSTDSIIEVQPTGPTSGAIVWEWHVWDHLVQDFAPQKAGFGVVRNHPELIDINYPRLLQLPCVHGVCPSLGSEFNHANGIDYDPIHDWIIISSPVQNEIWIIDHSTTTAEAAGHSGGRWGKGGDLLYRWGNPAAYRAGPASAQQLHFQHDPQFVPQGYPGAGHVTVFDNRFTEGRSRVLELVLPVDPQGSFILTPGGAFGPAAPIWTYAAPGFFSNIMSGAERLPNGNTLICSATQGWIFEVTPAGQIVWQHTSSQGAMFHAHHTQRSLWASQESLSAGAGGNVDFNLEASSSRAGESYALLGTASGTSPGFTINGVNVPLNIDGYLVGVLSSVGTGVFASWVGTFDAAGGASASFALPPLPFFSGLTLDHAFVSIDLTTSTLTFSSNPVPLAFKP